ncbi:MAG: glycosyltransferase family 2 protein, partial [Thermomicrobium sp.]|nr:glycosyltransferase family 2 protein [Thermomicrobium sp.]
MSDSTTSPGVTTVEARALQPANVTAGASRGVWVVVVNYNTADLLERCVEALRASRLDRPCTVIVVDNGSRDTSVERVRSRFPDVVLLEVGQNVGFARANNLAVRRILALVPESARWDHAVLLLNSDCFVEAGTIQRLVAVLDEEPDVAVVGPKLVLPDGRLDLACRRSFPTLGSAFAKLTGLASLFPRSRWLARYNLTFLDPDRAADVDAVSGACMAVRLSVIAEVGLLDEAFFMYG